MLLCDVRGWRNNNPGNLTDTAIDWDGETGLNLDPNFEEFTTPEYGIRAIGKLLLNYQKIHGIDTVTGVVSRYAPNTENPTADYIDFVCNETGLKADEPISIHAHLFPLVKAIIKFEMGIQPYSDDLIVKSLNMI